MEKEGNPQNYRYERSSDGTYTMRNASGHVIVSTKHPAVLFDRDNGTLIKHGDYDRVRRVLVETRAELARSGNKAHRMAEALTIYTSKEFDVEELNRCVSITGYCKSLIAKLSIQ